MNLNDWMYHLSLRAALGETGAVEPFLPARRGRERAPSIGARRAALACAALIAPALLVAAALLGG